MGSTRKPLAVLLIHWGNSGGGPRFAIDQARALSVIDGVRVWVSYSAGCDVAEDWAALGLPSFVVKTYKSRIQVLSRVPQLIDQAFRLRRFIKRHEIDVVYSAMFSIWQSFAVPIYVARGALYVQSVHDATEHRGDEHWIKKACRRIEDRRSDMIVTYSESTRALVRTQVSVITPVIAVHLGVTAQGDIARQLPSMDAPIRIGFFGRIRPYKGLELFVGMIAMLRARGFNVHGCVHGDGNVPAELVESSKESIDWNIRWIEDSEIAGMLEPIAVLALPYLEASQSAVLTLAAGYGIPVAATPVGGLTEQVEASGCGLISEELTLESYTAMVQTLISDPAIYSQCSANGIGSATGILSWESAARVLASEFRNLNEGGARNV